MSVKEFEKCTGNWVSLFSNNIDFRCRTKLYSNVQQKQSTPASRQQDMTYLKPHWIYWLNMESNSDPICYEATGLVLSMIYFIQLTCITNTTQKNCFWIGARSKLSSKFEIIDRTMHHGVVCTHTPVRYMYVRVLTHRDLCTDQQCYYVWFAGYL